MCMIFLKKQCIDSDLTYKPVLSYTRNNHDRVYKVHVTNILLKCQGINAPIIFLQDSTTV